jgi:hypothetical protein
MRIEDFDAKIWMKVLLDFRNIRGTKIVILQNSIKARPGNRAGFFVGADPGV